MEHFIQEELFAPNDGRGSGFTTELPPVVREPTWGEDLSPNAFWVFDCLQIGGHSKYMPGRAKIENIDLDAGMEELRSQGLLDESNPDYPEIKWPE